MAETCPKCGARRYRVDEGIDGRPVEWWACESDTDGDFNQSDACRIRELEQLVRDMLPLAMWHSCRHHQHERANPRTSCCDWSAIVARIEAAHVTEEVCHGHD